MDALIPASEAAIAAGANGDNFATTARIAGEKAVAGAENTINLKATAGRAGYMGERSVGSKDPGAEAIAQILTAFADYLNM